MRSSEATKENMFSIIRQWQQAGLNQKQYCQQHNIQYHVFHYWYKQFRDEQQETATTHKRFIQLNTPTIAGDAFAELVLANGNRLIFHQPVSSDYLKTFLR
jgi:transposase-like protein